MFYKFFCQNYLMNINSSKEQHLFEIEICNIINVFTVLVQRLTQSKSINL